METPCLRWNRLILSINYCMNARSWSALLLA